MKPLTNERLMKAIDAYAAAEESISYLWGRNGDDMDPKFYPLCRHSRRLRNLIQRNVLNLR